MTRGRVLGMVLFVTLLALFATPWAGTLDVPWRVLWQPGDDWASRLFWSLRVPRTLTGFLAGACLACSGLAFQSLFRNPLATPFTLGVSSGASLGAVLFLRMGWSVTWAVPGSVLAAFLGALCSIGLVYGLVRATGAVSTSRLLLSGVAVNFFFSSLIMFVHYTADFQDTFRLMRWLMGGLTMSGYGSVWELLPFAVGGGVLLGYLASELNLLATGEEMALSRGVEVGRTRNVILFATALIEGAVVAVCGPIGFIGIMVPHMCRLMIGGDHRYLLPASFLLGGALLVVSDTVARTVAMPAEIPVGVITALLGGPFFLWLLLGRSARGRYR